MLERFTAAELAGYRSPLLLDAGVPHLFTAATAGPAASDFALPAPLNEAAEADRRSLPASYRRLLGAMGCSAHRVAWVRQVHGRSVATLEPAQAAHHPCADALVTKDPGLVLTIRVADCVPILLAAPGQAVAAVHAGWRRVVAGVVPAAIAALKSDCGDAESLLAAIGPCISVDRFEVGPEVAAEFARAGLAEAVRDRPGARPHVDLRRAVHQQLRAAGVPEAQIDATDRCTCRDAADFFSHRRDGSPRRMVAAIALRT